MSHDPGRRSALRGCFVALVLLALCLELPNKSSLVVTGRCENQSAKGDTREPPASLRLKLIGHTGRIESIVFSPDGLLLATASRDSTVKLWRVDSGSVKYTLPMRKGWPANYPKIALSPDGKTLATFGVREKAVKLWDVETWKLRATLSGHTKAILTAAFSPDGRTLATGSYDKTAKLWDVLTGQLKATLADDKKDALHMRPAFSPNGQTVLTTDGGGDPMLWDASTGRLKAVLAGHKGLVLEALFSPDGELVATAGNDHDPAVNLQASAKLWEVETGHLMRQLSGHEASIFDMAFSPDGKLLASASQDGTVKLWDAATGKMKFSTEKDKQIARRVIFNRGGETFAVGYFDHAKIFDTATSQEKANPSPEAGPIEIYFSPDGLLLVTTSDKTVDIWNTKNGEKIVSLDGARPPIAFSQDGRIIATSSRDDAVLLWNLSSK